MSTPVHIARYHCFSWCKDNYSSFNKYALLVNLIRLFCISEQPERLVLNMFNRNHVFNISTRDRPSLQDLHDESETLNPSRDLETWTRFRIAVNGRICENIKQKATTLDQSQEFSSNITNYIEEEVTMCLGNQFILFIVKSSFIKQECFSNNVNMFTINKLL